jgi:hypothetical protein
LPTLCRPGPAQISHRNRAASRSDRPKWGHIPQLVDAGAGYILVQGEQNGFVRRFTRAAAGWFGRADWRLPRW